MTEDQKEVKANKIGSGVILGSFAVGAFLAYRFTKTERNTAAFLGAIGGAIIGFMISEFMITPVIKN